MKEIKLYTKVGCPYCAKAKRMLNDNGYDFSEVDVTHDLETRAQLAQKHGQTTVPYVFVGDELIGGSSDLEDVMNKGQFEDKVRD